MPDAEVSSSTAPGKVEKIRSDGSFTLQVKEHTGTFTLTVKKTGYAPVTISISAKKTNHTVPVIQLAKVYTTTVRGKVITPARAADPAKGSIITTARVWASTDPTKKIAVGADGSYSLQVAGHSGSFTITADYTATGNKNYKTSDPKTVTTKSAAIENQDIPLNYGYTITIIGKTYLYPPFGSEGTLKPGIRVTAEVEGVELTSSAGRDTSDGSGDYRITFSHPGSFVLIGTAFTDLSGNTLVSPKTSRVIIGETRPTLSNYHVSVDL